MEKMDGEILLCASQPLVLLRTHCQATCIASSSQNSLTGGVVAGSSENPMPGWL